jgi:hypothetical protein
VTHYDGDVLHVVKFGFKVGRFLERVRTDGWNQMAYIGLNVCLWVRVLHDLVDTLIWVTLIPKFLSWSANMAMPDIVPNKVEPWWRMETTGARATNFPSSDSTIGSF